MIEDENGHEQSLHQVKGFRIVHVFDISQTEGQELPDLEAVRPKLLDGDAPDGVWDALIGHAESIGFEVLRERRGRENGYCDFGAKLIAVRPDVSSSQAVKTLIHELGHALLHSEGPILSKEVAEIEVESVAYIVCDALGLDAGNYSFPYVTRWAGGDVEAIRSTADRVVACAKSILDNLSSPTHGPDC